MGVIGKDWNLGGGAAVVGASPAISKHSALIIYLTIGIK